MFFLNMIFTIIMIFIFLLSSLTWCVNANNGAYVSAAVCEQDTMKLDVWHGSFGTKKTSVKCLFVVENFPFPLLFLILLWLSFMSNRFIHQLATTIKCGIYWNVWNSRIIRDPILNTLFFKSKSVQLFHKQMKLKTFPVFPEEIFYNVPPGGNRKNHRLRDPCLRPGAAITSLFSNRISILSFRQQTWSSIMCAGGCGVHLVRLRNFQIIRTVTYTEPT